MNLPPQWCTRARLAGELDVKFEMLIPRYWAKAEGHATPPGQSTPYALRAWGCSPTSHEDAQSDADTRLQNWIIRLQSGEQPRGHYAYGRSLMREELLQELPGTGDAPAAIVTRNRYGCLVLNAARTLFLDVDLPSDNLGRRLWSLFRGRAESLAEQVVARIRAALETNPGAGFRLYRTAAGYRILGTDRLYDPAAPTTVALMQAAGTDPSFVTLSRVQDCFRARLSPKPWRIGQQTPIIDFPFPTTESVERARAWQASYESAAANWATCEFLGHYGPSDVHPEVATVLAFHDAATRADSGLPLA